MVILFVFFFVKNDAAIGNTMGNSFEGLDIYRSV